jgi:hypothetical protein
VLKLGRCGVERADRRLHRTPEGVQGLSREVVGLVGLLGERPFPGGRDRDRLDPVGDQGRLGADSRRDR